MEKNENPGPCFHNRSPVTQPSCAFRDHDRYQLIVDTAQEGIWEIDSTFSTTFVNQKLADMLGYSTEEMIGMSVGLIFSCHLGASPFSCTSSRLLKF
jgi:PAS domain-containing protein